MEGEPDLATGQGPCRTLDTDSIEVLQEPVVVALQQRAVLPAQSCHADLVVQRGSEGKAGGGRC